MQVKLRKKCLNSWFCKLAKRRKLSSLARFVARCYQRVLMIASDEPGDASAADAVEGVASDPQLENNLTANEVDGGSFSNEDNEDLAAEEEGPNISETLSELFCALEQNDIVAKVDIVRKFSPQSKLADDVFLGGGETNDDPSLLGQKDRPREDDEDCSHDPHAKRGRFKEKMKQESSAEKVNCISTEQSVESSTVGTVSVPLENFLNKCIMITIRHLSARLDEDATRRLKHALDKMRLAQEGDNADSDAISKMLADLHGKQQSASSEDIYGESMSSARDGGTVFGLNDYLDQHTGEMRRNDRGLVMVDALWWRRLPNLMDDVFELKDDRVNLNIGGVMNTDWLKFHNDYRGTHGRRPASVLNSSSGLVEEDGAELAAGAVALLRLGVALMSNAGGDEEAKVSSDTNAQEIRTQPAPSPLIEVNLKPIQPFMTKDQEERARMFALFKTVDPGKLATLDELFEKRARSNGFDRMWMSYKQKWGAAAVEKAFANVRKKKKAFYRAKMVALFVANQPGKLKQVDDLMAKHNGQYDQMFKRWVKNKKFDVHSVTDAHNKAMHEVGLCEA